MNNKLRTAIERITKGTSRDAIHRVSHAQTPQRASNETKSASEPTDAEKAPATAQFRINKTLLARIRAARAKTNTQPEYVPA